MTGQSFVFLSFRQSITFFPPVDLAVHPHLVGASPFGSRRIVPSCLGRCSASPFLLMVVCHAALHGVDLPATLLPMTGM